MAQHERNPKVLIATIGTGSYFCARYVVAGSEGRDAGWPTEYSPVATAGLFLGLEEGEKARALILCTPEAKDKHFEAISFQLRAVGCEPEAVEIGMGRTPGEQFHILGRLAEKIPKGARITADFTLSLRHLGLAFVAALGQLVALRDAVVETVAYGAFELKDGEGNVPLVDATPLFRLIEWSQAARAFAHRGDLAPLHEFIVLEWKSAKRRGESREIRKALDGLSKPVKDLGWAEHAGLPLETGLRSRELLEKLDRVEGELPAPMRILLERLRPRLQEWAVPDGISKKCEIPLSVEELHRELRLVEHYLETDNPARALRLLREWLVNLVIYRTSNPGKWLIYKDRKPVGRLLTVLQRRTKYGQDDEELTLLAETWKTVSGSRNDVAHAAFTEKNVKPIQETIRKRVDICRKLLDARLDLTNLERGAHLLVTPLGMSPGVLYTALTALEPDRVLVVTSSEARRNMEEAARRAGSDAPLEVFEIADPLRGYLEADRKLNEEEENIEALLASCGRVTVNLTGGTTLLGWVAGEIGRMAEKLVPSVRRVALVDDRPQQEQKEQPWVEGEVLELRAPE